MVCGDRAQVNITQPDEVHRTQQSMMSQGRGTGNEFQTRIVLTETSFTLVSDPGSEIFDGLMKRGFFDNMFSR